MTTEKDEAAIGAALVEIRDRDEGLAAYIAGQIAKGGELVDVARGLQEAAFALMRARKAATTGKARP